MIHPPPMIGLPIFSYNEEKSDFQSLDFSGSICCPTVSNNFFPTSEFITRDNELHIIPDDKETERDDLSPPNPIIPYITDGDHLLSPCHDGFHQLSQNPTEGDNFSSRDMKDKNDILKEIQAPLSSDQKEFLAIHLKVQASSVLTLTAFGKEGNYP